MSGANRINKGLAIAIAATFAVTLAGCSGNGGGAGGDVKQDENSALEVWIRKAPDSPPAITAQKFVDAFTEKTGIPTELTTIQDGFETKLEQAAAQKDLPDIIINDGAQGGNMADKGLVRTIDRSTFAADDQVKPQAWDQATMTDGSVIGVPVNAQSFALFIRADWRKNLGLELPETWDDLDEMARAFTNEDPDGNGKNDTSGWVIPASTERGYASWYFSTFQYSAGGDVFSGEPGSYTPTNAA
ncbi:MAG TPA: extracellular solute-binding protein, partial [Microbacterium sp.]|nr:extracellular solute-binding protein [Microbacterium sp.]